MFAGIINESERRHIIFDIEGVIIADCLRNGGCQVSARHDLRWPVLVLPQEIRRGGLISGLKGCRGAFIPALMSFHHHFEFKYYKRRI